MGEIDVKIAQFEEKWHQIMTKIDENILTWGEL